VIFARKSGVENGQIHPHSLVSLCFQFTRGWEIAIDVKCWTNWSSEKGCSQAIFVIDLALTFTKDLEFDNYPGQDIASFEGCF